MKRIISGFLFVLLSFVTVLGQVANIIPATNRVDWIPGVTIGVFGGIPNRTTINATISAGASVATINSAIAACTSNQVVKLSAGNYGINGIVEMKSGVTLRGAGVGVTTLTMTSSAILRMLGDSTESAASTNLLYSSLVKGATNISTITGGPSIVAGNTLLIFEDNDTNIVQIFNTATNKMTVDAVRVISVTGTNVNFWPPLTWNFTDSTFTPRYRVVTGAQLEFAGVEDMTLIPDSSIQYPVYMVFAYSCWAKNLVITNIPSQGVYSYASLLCQGEHVDILKSQSSGDGYGFNFDADGVGLTWWGAHRFWINNSIFDGLYHGVIATADVGAVVSYCFSTNEHAPSGVTFPTASFNAAHGSGGRMGLWEGNYGSAYFTTDRIHGNTTHQTLWRDRFAGWANAASLPNMHMPMLWLGQGSYWFSAVGCVLGDSWSAPGAHRQYKYTGALWDAESSTDSGGILFLGYAGYGNAEESKVGNTFTGYRNYDFWHSAIFDETSAAGSPTVDNSLIYTSKPTFFANLTWPPIDPSSPNVTPASIPAGYRYINGSDPSSITTPNVSISGRVALSGFVRVQ